MSSTRKKLFALYWTIAARNINAREVLQEPIVIFDAKVQNPKAFVQFGLKAASTPAPSSVLCAGIDDSNNPADFAKRMYEVGEKFEEMFDGQDIPEHIKELVAEKKQYYISLMFS
mmetsp:Transcript_21737/g.33232  ORF Transcript_21737/g.33232 Transcript_21737/m.33232 type:complete len:115 (+) Transcript_21737:140-484(+)